MGARCQLKQLQDDAPCFEYIDTAALLGTDNPPVQRWLFEDNGRRGRKLKNILEVAFRKNFHIDGSGVNQSVGQTTNGTAYWRGHILALRWKGTDSDSPHYDNMTVADLRDVVDYFQAYSDVALTGQTPVLSRKVKGVRVNCQGDQHVFGAEKHAAVEVPQDHPIFTDAPTSLSLSNRIDLPMLTRKYPVHKAWATAVDGAINQAVTFLHADTDPVQSAVARIELGLAPRQWQNKVGSILMVRADGKDLSPHQCEVLCDFCQYEVQPLYDEYLAGDLSEDAASQQMTKDTFERYFVQYRARRIAEDPSWEAETSPYLA